MPVAVDTHRSTGSLRAEGDATFRSRTKEPPGGETGKADIYK
jgi:hypothetical protein